MFVAIIGTRFSGKSSIEDYLISIKGFKSVRIVQSNSDHHGEEKFEVTNSRRSISSDTTDPCFPLSLSLSPLPEPSPSPILSMVSQQSLYFSTPGELLKYVTENWRNNYVTVDLYTRQLVEPFVRRPFFILLRCDAPLMERFNRSKSFLDIPLKDFVQEDDRTVFGSLLLPDPSKANCLQNLADLVNIHVNNSFPNLEGFYRYLDALDLLHPEHLRPSWDTYFMTLASLASRRSNCMKRRVGAVLIRDYRVLATGYNGTPRGLKNCNEGGCPHCNATAIPSSPGNGCVCLHAEENALLEAGSERMGKDCVLYCNTCPCLTCTIKIIQTGVKTVVYNLTYKVDEASAMLFKQAGVHLRRYDPNTRFRVPLPIHDEKISPEKSSRQNIT